MEVMEKFSVHEMYDYYYRGIFTRRIVFFFLFVILSVQNTLQKSNKYIFYSKYYNTDLFVIFILKFLRCFFD